MRLRQSILSVIGLGILMSAFGAACAMAQDASDDSYLLNPRPTGDPRSTPRFDNLMKGDAPVFRRRTFGVPSGSGAGTTGFVSMGSGKKKKKTPAPETRPAPAVIAPLDATLAPIYRVPPAPASPSRPQTGRPGDPTLPARPVRRFGEEDAFAPVGIRAGTFILKPAVEITGGFDSNPGRITGGGGSTFTQVSPELLIASNWSRHEFNATLKGNYIWYQDLPAYNRPTIDLKANGRFEINSQTHADFEGRYQHSTDTPGNPNNPTDIAAPPAFDKYGGTAGLTHRFNRLEITAKGDVDRQVYQDATLNDGTTLKLDDRNYNQYGGSLRASYEWLPGVKPFVEIGADQRVHDLTTDYTGVQRDSDGRSIRAGTSFELTRKLTGEASIGYLTRSYQDPTLTDLRGTTFDSSLIYTATALTTATLTAKSVVDESTMTGVSGILRRDVGLQIDHSFRRWLVATAKVGYGLDEYQGIGREDQRYVAGIALIYKMSREMQLKGEFRQEWLHSNLPGQDYTASIVTFGLRLQR